MVPSLLLNRFPRTQATVFPILLCAQVVHAANDQAITESPTAQLPQPLVATTQVGTSTLSSPSTASEEVVVTGTRTEKALWDSPVRVELVTRSDIEKIHARDLREVVKDVPGVSIQPMHGKSGYEVWLQGISSDRVLVLLDGEPIAPTSGTSVDLSQIAASDIERVEIIKGASSALYGSDAIGGVINAITRKPTEEFGYELTLDSGSFQGDIRDESKDQGKQHVQGRISTNVGQLTSQVNFDWRNSDGFGQNNDPWYLRGGQGDRYNGYLRSDFEVNENSSVYAYVSHYEDDLKNRYYSINPGNPLQTIKREKIDRTRIGSGTAFQTSFGDFKVRASQEDYNSETHQDIVNTVDRIDQIRNAETQNQQFSSQWNISDKFGTWTSGYEFFREELDQLKNGVSELDPPGGVSHFSHEAFLQYDLDTLDYWEIVPGFRYQNDSDFGSYLAPKVSVRRDLSNTGARENFVRFSIGKGYRAPSLKERHYTFDHRHIGYEVLGNPDLTPEYSTSLQLGWGLLANNGMQFDANLFYNDLKDLIETLSTIPAGPTRPYVTQQYVNVSQALTQGLELSGIYRDWENWQLKSSLVFLDSEDKTTGKELPKRARQQVKASLEYEPIENLSLLLSGKWQSRTYNELSLATQTPAYSVFDLKVNFQITPTLSLFGGGDNLSDTQKDYLDPQHADDQRPVEGRFIYLGFRLTQ